MRDFTTKLKTYRCQKSRFARIRKADKANISYHLQLELQFLLLSLFSLSSRFQISDLRCVMMMKIAILYYFQGPLGLLELP